MTRVRLGTRASALALWQAHWTRDALKAAHPDLEVEIVHVHSEGDQDQVTPLSQMGAIGIFTQTLERELTASRIDVAVHSLKDVPAQLGDGLTLAAYGPRADARDAWFARGGISLERLPDGSRVATGSLRRRCQILARRPQLEVIGLRGNVDTRLRKFHDGEFDAMVLAAAGVTRLGRSDEITAHLPVESLLPAVGQGIVGLEVRRGDAAEALVAAIGDPVSDVVARAERALLAGVAGGCIVPLAGYAVENEGELWLRARLGAVDGSTMLEAEARGSVDDPESLGFAVAEDLLSRGGAALVAQARQQA